MKPESARWRVATDVADRARVHGVLPRRHRPHPAGGGRALQRLGSRHDHRRRRRAVVPAPTPVRDAGDRDRRARHLHGRRLRRRAGVPRAPGPAVHDRPTRRSAPDVDRGRRARSSCCSRSPWSATAGSRTSSTSSPSPAGSAARCSSARRTSAVGPTSPSSSSGLATSRRPARRRPGAASPRNACASPATSTT